MLQPSRERSTGGGLLAGREAVRHIVGRDPASLDTHGVARAAIESLAENFSDGVVAPVFWYLVLGLPGLFAYKTANTLDSMIGHQTPHYRCFGWAAARFDDFANLAPARSAALLIAAAALFSPDGRPSRALAIMLRDGRKHRSPNAGWPEGAMAGALGLALAGPRRYAGGRRRRSLGRRRHCAGRDPPTSRRALILYKIACLIEWRSGCSGPGSRRITAFSSEPEQAVAQRQAARRDRDAVRDGRQARRAWCRPYTRRRARRQPPSRSRKARRNPSLAKRPCK